MAAEEEEVMIEVEALQAVYGDDCLILHSFPPHLHLHIKPRTADVSSQQFVEAVIGIRAGPQYPEDLPYIHLIESKGLDEQREKQLITGIEEKARELSSCLMLVALCEEAVEKLSAMNHPDGNCPLCLYPLVPEDEKDEKLPFMKLMSCFHCFHSKCIIRWWNWLHKDKGNNSSVSSTKMAQPITGSEYQNDLQGALEGSLGNCPVCRKGFHAKDLEHVLDLVGTQTCQLGDGSEVDDAEVPESDSENNRRQRFEAILKIQQENSGLIEQKKGLVVLPGMFLPQQVTLPTHTSDREKEQQRDSKVPLETQSGPSGTSSSRPPTSIQHKNSGRGRQRVHHSGKQTPPHHSGKHTTVHHSRKQTTVQNSGKQVRQWVRKEDGTAS